MFGNRLGWVLAVIEIGLMGVVLWMLMEANKPSPPGEFGRNAAKYTLALPVSPRDLIALSGTQDGGSRYLDAIKDYAANVDRYEEVRSAASIDAAGVKDPLPAFKSILDASHCPTADIFTSNPARVIVAEGSECKVAAEQLTKLGQLVERVGFVHRLAADKLKKDHGDAAAIRQQEEEAKKWFEAELTLGLHMYEERVVVEECQGGLGMLSGAARELKALDPVRATAYETFIKGYGTASKEIEQVREKIIRIGIRPSRQTGESEEIPQFTADMLAVAQTTACDRLWRVEATLALGRMKINAERFADRQESYRALRRLKSSPDPVLSTAAKVAWEQTADQFSRLGRAN